MTTYLQNNQKTITQRNGDNGIVTIIEIVSIPTSSGGSMGTKNVTNYAAGAEPAIPGLSPVTAAEWSTARSKAVNYLNTLT